MLCLNLLSTYPIMAQSALRISENIFADKASGTVATPVSLGGATAFTAGALDAANVPNFGVVLGYVGGVCCSILSLVLPATILYLAQKKVGNEITSNELARTPPSSPRVHVHRSLNRALGAVRQLCTLFEDERVGYGFTRALDF